MTHTRWTLVCTAFAAGLAGCHLAGSQGWVVALFLGAACAALAACGSTRVSAAAPDGGVSAPDGGVSMPDGGVSMPDGGVSTPDGGVSVLDGGVSALDGGVSALDGGVSALDGGVSVPDGGRFEAGLVPCCEQSALAGCGCVPMRYAVAAPVVFCDDGTCSSNHSVTCAPPDGGFQGGWANCCDNGVTKRCYNPPTAACNFGQVDVFCPNGKCYSRFVGDDGGCGSP